VALDELEKAVQIYEEQTSQAPGDVTAWYGLGICYERMAESASKKLARLPGNATYSKRLLAEYLQNAGDERLAREAFGDAEDTKNIDSPEARATFEQARMLAGKAKHAFEQVVSLAPGSWQTAVFLGDVDRQHGRLLSALEHYRQAASIDPNNTAALLGIGTVYWELGDFERAADSLQEVCKRNPQAAQATFELGNIAVRQHREAQAIPLLERYLAQQPDALAARADLGRAYFHLKEYAKALPELKKAAATDEQGDIHYQLSICLRQQGRIEEAEAALQASRAIREAQNDRLRRLQANQ
jgi:tetratricopeptide (TPR) repeat protein